MKPTLAGVFSLALGLSALLLGITTLFGTWQPQSGSSCKAICGLSLLAAEFLGPAAGSTVAGLLWIGAGGAASFFGIRILREA